MDFLRLTTAQMSYSGITLAMSLSVLVAVMSWERRSPMLLGLSALLGLVSARSYEGAIPVLLAIPVVLWVMPDPRSGTDGSRPGAFWRWSAV